MMDAHPVAAFLSQKSSLEMELLMQVPRPDHAASKQLLTLLDSCDAKLTAYLARPQGPEQGGLSRKHATEYRDAVRRARQLHAGALLN